MLACALQMFQQFSGSNLLMYFSATILQKAGLSGTSHTAIWYVHCVWAVHRIAE